jgi:PQQ-dependent dehydrogenase (methanol/ethanol family)
MALANAELLRLQQDPNQWVMPQHDYSGNRYSTLDQINTGNASNLGVAWTFSTGVLRGHEGGPLVIGDVLYFVTPIPNIVYALDLNDNGAIIWKYNPVKGGKYPSGELMERVISVMCCDNVNEGAAYADGKLFIYAADTSVIAIDAKTGKEIWVTTNLHAGTGIRGVSASTGSSAPFVVKDKVLIGCSGAEFGVRCNMTAYDIKSGKRVWRAYSMGPDGDLLVDPNKTTHLGKPIGKDSSIKTWPSNAWEIGGGSLWGFWSYDPDLDLIYYGTGNPSTWNPVVRPGDNRWSMTMMARNPDTGMARWFYQMTPHDEWDYDGINETILADIPVKGKNRKIVAHFDRNGFAYTLDRATGELLVAEHLPRRSRLEEQGPCVVLAADWPVLRADEPRLHGLRASPGRVRGG